MADRTIYRVLLVPNASPSAAQLRAVARVSGENVLQAKRALAECPTASFAGRAEAVLSVLAVLDEAKVMHKVEPALRWTAADAPEAVWTAGLRPASLDDPPVVRL